VKVQEAVSELPIYRFPVGVVGVKAPVIINLGELVLDKPSVTTT